MYVQGEIFVIDGYVYVNSKLNSGLVGLEVVCNLVGMMHASEYRIF